MMILGHVSSDKHAQVDQYYATGLLYPDVFVVSNRISHTTTHYLGTLSTRALQIEASIQGAQVARFARGMLKHLHDDRRLPFIAEYAHTWALPICSQVREVCSLGALAKWHALVERTLLTEIVEAVIDLTLARQTTTNPLQLLRPDAALDDAAIMRFVTSQWSLDSETVTYINARWIEGLRQWSQYSVEELVVTEMRIIWPKLVGAHLSRVGLLTPRESVMARHQIEDNLDEILALMWRTSQTLDGRLRLDTFLRPLQPQRNASNPSWLAFNYYGY